MKKNRINLNPSSNIKPNLEVTIDLPELDTLKMMSFTTGFTTWNLEIDVDTWVLLSRILLLIIKNIFELLKTWH
jgi:hypothetical protein